MLMVHPDQLMSLWKMFEVYGPDLHDAIAELERLKALIERFGQGGQNTNDNMNPTDRGLSLGILEKAMVPLAKCGAQLAYYSAFDLRVKLRDANAHCSYVDAWAAFNDINRRFKDELSLVKMYVIYRDKNHLLQSASEQFGEAVTDKFPSIQTDVSESALCLCYGRPTASVFHSMRIVEVGLEAFRKHVDIPDPVVVNDRNWGNIINALRDPINARWPQKTCLPGTEGSHIRAVFESLQTIKSSVRDRTMHVERTYSDSQAELVRLNVREFMSELAERCDENGEPKAPPLAI